MITTLSNRYQKTIAFCFLLIFYSSIVAPAYAAKIKRNNAYSVYYSYNKRKSGYKESISGNARNRPLFFTAPEAAPVVVAGKTVNKATKFMPSQKYKAQKLSRKFSGGPGQPEMQSFQSVSSSNMVDMFTGNFSYNIPLMDVGGYPVNIHYSSGISMDQEASWVGLGWNINPGTIGRNMRGIPDDFNGEDVITKTMNIRPNWTVGAGISASVEALGFEIGKRLANAGGISADIFYNNYRGIGLSVGASANLAAGKGAKGKLSGGLGLSLKNNSQSGLTISPSFELMYKSKNDWYRSNGFNTSAAFSTRSGLQSLTISAKGTKRTEIEKWIITKGSGFAIPAPPTIIDANGSHSFSPISFSHQAYTPTISAPYTSFNFSLSVKPGWEWTGIATSPYLSGYYSTQYIANEDTTYSAPGFGYLNFSKAKGRSDALLDFNREKELAYREKPSTPHLAVPIYTYDIYSITGEGTGGMFRPYRSDIGYMHDHAMKTKAVTGNAAFEVAGGNLIKGGFDVSGSYSTTENNIWQYSNGLKRNIEFSTADSTFEPVYFRNPAEKTINSQEFYDKIGDTDPLLPVLNKSTQDGILTNSLTRYQNNIERGIPLQFKENEILKTKRAKRSQVISYLTAADAAKFGLDTLIKIYPVNKFFGSQCDSIYCENGDVPPSPNCNRIIKEKRINSFRKPHHLSEISVLNADGRRYIYGLPVYNLTQDEVSFSADKNRAETTTGLVGYNPGEDNTTKNKNGKDHYYMREQMPAYAHSFLLTGVLSTDYVDRLNDGITDDDQGDAVKFNYSRVYGSQNPYQWRTPFQEGKATYNEGLKTDNSDDKGNYIHGSKEIMYLNSLESKTMIATFKLNEPEKGEIREDVYGVKNENGGKETTAPLRYLKEINLYSKSDFIKNRENARAIKTVHFEYNYELCKNAPGSAAGKGKLTLKRIWFTYNNNNKGRRNPYVFYYHPGNIKTNDTLPKPAYNPDYDIKSYDRWGNYKNNADNPNQLDNADYPYVIQDSAKAAVNVAAWTLSDIQLPSGALMNVTYESDDYAYVQNKRAGQMCQLAGIGKGTVFANANNLLYSTVGPLTTADHPYVFIRVPKAVDRSKAKQDIMEKYLDGIKKLYFRYKVKMPEDPYGKGFENVSTYAQIEDFGLSEADDIIWVKMKGTHMNKPGDGDRSPLAKTAIQTLRLNLPSKAYPGSDLGDDFADKINLIKAEFGFLFNASELFTNFPQRARLLSWAKEVNLNESFVRLNNPAYKKYGGGARVKRVVVYDNWNKMTGQKEATYGQEYDYTTVKKINGKDIRISSGVASYEPTIGNEENPFKEPIEYDEQIATFAPFNDMYSEEPLGEAFFPSAGVGYSKVRTHTIHYKDIKSANGYEESEFYTTYDFPTLTERTPLDEKKFKSSFLAQALGVDVRRFLTQTQGFKVEINDMDGKMKASASYPENDPNNPLAYSRYYYKVDDDSAEFKHLNNTVSVVNNATGVVTNAQVGKDIELMVDFREQQSITLGANVEYNTDGFFLGIIPVAVPTVWWLPKNEIDQYRSAATMKLVQRYGILDKVVSYEKGSLVSAINMVYDGETGEVLVSKTQNEFDDPLYSFSYPAHWAYSGMEAAYKNIGAEFNTITITDGKITSAPAAYGTIERFFESGDEIKLESLRKNSETGSTDPCTGETIACSQIVWNANTDATRIWAVDAAKIQQNKGYTGLVFIDENGKFVTTQAGAKLTILRSGKRNLLSTAVGSIASLASPVRTVGTEQKIVFDDATKVINASAARFKDYWKVEDAKYQKDTVVVQKKYAVQENLFTPSASYSIMQSRKPTAKVAFINTPYFESASLNYGTNRGDGQVRSWLQFDLQGIPAGATIISAELAMVPHFGDHQETRGYICDNLTGCSTQRKDHNHGIGNPHQYEITNGGTNEAIIGRDINTALTNISLPNLLDNSTLTEAVYSGSVLSRPAIVKAMNKQGSVIVNVTGSVQEMINNPGSPQIFSMRPNNTASNARNRLCFWSTNSLTTGDCNIYLSNPIFAEPSPGQNNLAPVSATASISAAATAPVCNTPNCSVVPPGTGLNICSTSPRLKIRFINCAPGEQLQQICDSLFCTSSTRTTDCFSYITAANVNPYRWGILGNWRMDRAYTNFDRRKESDPSVKTNIRKDGVVNNFAPYWTFASTNLQPTTDSIKWVWNSEMTLFNRKGFELENKDPLGRHNAAQYGYNQTVPIAVTQNAKYREQAFEGFEDTEYDNDKCAKPCPLPKHLNIILGNQGKIDSTESHTGRFSVAVNGAQNVLIDQTFTTSSFDSVQPLLQFKIDTLRIVNKTVSPKGTGLHYESYGASGTPLSFSSTDYNNDVIPYYVFPPLAPRAITGSNTSILVVSHDSINFNYGASMSNPRVSTSAIGRSYYFIKWKGFIQPDVSGLYEFKFINPTNSASPDNGARFWLNGKLLLNDWPNDPVYPSTATSSVSIRLEKGKLYKLDATYTQGPQTAANHSCVLSWKKPGTTTFAAIPRKYYYKSTINAADTLGSVSQQVLANCRNYDGIRTSSNIIYKTFSPTPGKKYVISAWVKEQKDCKCDVYKNTEMVANFYDNNNSLITASTVTCKPSGNIIEGWQRIEEFVTIPLNAVTMKIQLRSTAATQAEKSFFDDIRILPFNANMKSFIYNAVDLRLMAELDENNYASFYEYDDDGTLIRVKKETERGIKTITETRSALIKQ
jgi:PA14 domain